MQLTDENRQKFQRKFDESVIAPLARAYVSSLEQDNYEVWDRLAMLLLDYGDHAFVLGVYVAVALDPNAPQRTDDSFPF